MIKQMVEEENVSTDLYPGERLTTAGKNLLVFPTHEVPELLLFV